MSAKSMRRAERAATSLVAGEAILATLKNEQTRLVAAAKQSRPPVAAVSGILMKKHGDTVMELPVRQFVGLAVRAILEEAGFEVAYTGVRINGDPVFRTGSVYRPRTDDHEAPQQDDALERMLRALTPGQAARALRVLVRQFPNLLDESDDEVPKRSPAQRKPRG
jgi:hypothetical protein